MLSRASLGPGLGAPLLACLLAGAAAGASTARVTYLAGAMAYADAGSLDGLQTGDTLQVFRGGTTVAMIRVTYVSSHRVACDTLWTRDLLKIGDQLRFTPHALPAAPTAAAQGVTNDRDSRAPAPTAATGPTVKERPRVRGRIGGRYLSMRTDGSVFQQPALDLHLDVSDQVGGHLDLSLDVRNRRTIRSITGSTTSEQLSRVYRANTAVRTRDSRHRVTVGRQTSASLASVSLFDGVLVQSGGDGYSLGLFTGTQPDPVSFGLSREILENGGFVEFHSSPTSQRHYQFSLGGISSQQGGQPNRDFLITQASWSGRALTTQFTQELDFNRGWKREVGESMVSPTSTFWMMRVTPMPWMGIHAGYDNRRSVRLYRDRTTPVDQFDDAYRQGAWLGTDLEIRNRFRLSSETRGNIGGDRSQAWSGAAEAYRLTALNIALRGRMSEFTGSSVTSRLISVGLGFDLLPRFHIETAGGVRGTRIAPATSFDTQTWRNINLDLALGGRWYANGGLEYERGGSTGTTREAQGGLSLRF